MPMLRPGETSRPIGRLPCGRSDGLTPATKLHWLTPRRPGLNSACVLARRVRSTRPRARLSASGQTRKPQDWLAPKHPRDRLRHRSARPIHHSIPPAKFRRFGELIGRRLRKVATTGKNPGRPVRGNFPQTPGRIKTRPCRGQNLWAIVFAVFTPAITPPLLLARPTPSRAWERDQNPRQRLPLSPSAAVTAFAFADFLTRFRARLAVSRSHEASSNGRVTVSGFLKKL